MLNTTALSMLKPFFAGACNVVWVWSTRKHLFTASAISVSLSQEEGIILSHSCRTYLLCCSEVILLKLQSRLLQQWKLYGWSNTRNNTIKLPPFLGEKKINNKSKLKGRRLGRRFWATWWHKNKKAEITMVSIEKMKVIKKEFFLQLKIAAVSVRDNWCHQEIYRN